jgi:predicted solute-binding protein
VELARQLKDRRIALVYVHTLPDIAWQFYKRRTRTSITFAEFLTLRDADVERGIVDFLRLSDAVIYNWVGRKAYLATVTQLFKRVGVGTTARRLAGN